MRGVRDCPAIQQVKPQVVAALEAAQFDPAVEAGIPLIEKRLIEPSLPKAKRPA